MYLNNINIFKKFFIVIIVITSFKTCFANPFSIGSIKANSYNDVLDRWENRRISVIANVSGNGSSIAIYYEMALENYGVKYSIYFDENNKVKPQKYLNNLLNTINKSIEWSKTAKENNAETRREIPSEKFCALTYDGSNVECDAVFLSIEQGEKSFLLITIKKKENLTYDSDYEIFYLDLDNQLIFRDLLESEIYNKINDAIEIKKANDELFK